MLTVISLVVIADQTAKRMVAARLEEGFSTPSVLGVRFRHVVNRRGLWGSLRAIRVMAVAWLLFSAAALVVAIAIDSRTIYVATGLLIGGALGNLLDGISRNGVTDFIDLRIWPVFNVADTVIVAGAMLLAASVI